MLGRTVGVGAEVVYELCWADVQQSELRVLMYMCGAMSICVHECCVETRRSFGLVWSVRRNVEGNRWSWSKSDGRSCVEPVRGYLGREYWCMRVFSAWGRMRTEL